MAKPRAHRAATGQSNDVIVARGKRTGVNILSQELPAAGVLEDVDKFFEAVRSPEAEKENNKTKRKKSIRFSLNNGGSDDNSSTVKPSSYARKLIGKKTRGSMSPSELSRVSTAPPSTDRSLATHQGEEEEEDMEEVRMAQEEVEETHAYHQVDSPEAFPTDVDDATEDQAPVDEEDNDDDLMPPAPPDSPRAEENDPMEAPTQNEVDFPTQDFDDDDDKEGDGFNMATTPTNDPETPDSEVPVVQEKKKKTKKKETKKKSKKKEKSIEESEDELDTTTKSVPRKTKKTKKRSRFQTVWSPKGIPAGPREFNEIPVSELIESPEAGEKTLRRSKRARIKPLEYWKGEHIEWGANDFPSDDEHSGLHNMSVPKRVCKALPTPYKERKVSRAAVVSEGKKKGRGGKTNVIEAMPEVAPFDSKKIRKKYDYVDGEEAHMWDEGLEVAVDAKVVSFRAKMDERDLPLSKSRPKTEGKVVGKAAQAFNISSENDAYVGYIMGNLTLPPKGIKDPESVGSCAQTFTVVSCQPGAVEVAYSQPEEANGTLDPETAQRFLLGPGDLFRIPPGNCYRLQNHSKETECFMTWTIIRPVQSREGSSP